MASHSHVTLDNDLTQLRPGNKGLGVALMVVGLIAFIAAGVIAYAIGQGERFYSGLLFGVGAPLMVSCAALIFVLVNHLVRAGWITNVRRMLETMSMQIPLLGIFLLPVIVVTLFTMTTTRMSPVDHEPHTTALVYSWAVPSETEIYHHHAGEHHDEAHAPGGIHDEPRPHAEEPGPRPVDDPINPAGDLKEPLPANIRATEILPQHQLPVGKKDTPLEYAGETDVQYPNEQVRPGIDRPFDSIVAEKRFAWMIPWFWAFRQVAYFAILSYVAWYFWSRSVKQDKTGDVDISANLMTVAGPVLLAVGLIVTFIAFDMYMSLDPWWFSTMYGVYFFASGTQAMWAIMCLTFIILQARGYLKQSITTEHYHDMGKFLFAFVVFWTYIAFSQYMLQWYANLPEETFWFDKRGYSTAHPNGYSPLVLFLLIGRFCIPFLGLVSRHVKRNRFGLAFWSVWLLVCFVIDVYMLVLPEFYWAGTFTEIPFGLELLCLAGGVALWLGNVIRMMASYALRPVSDPRMHESLAIQNI